ncbi:MAG: signal peptide peptidase SppA [Ignavibacterium sp.]|nr:MAG: signal peptide peptidase SppA [Ignavibacterium sp.]
MKNIMTAVVVLILMSTSLLGQSSFPSYYEQNKFNLASPSVLKFGLYGYDNPALLSLQPSADLLFTWSDRTGEWNDLNQWGFFFAAPSFGFSVVNNKESIGTVTDFRISLAGGGDSFGIGAGVGWSSGDKDKFNRSTLFTLGTYIRPVRYVSFGLVGFLPTSGLGEGAVDLGIRPLGNEIVTVFGDYVIRSNKQPDDIKWSAGLILEPIDGLRITGRYFDTDIFNLGVALSFGNAGITFRSDFDKDGKHAYNIYGIRAGAYDRHPFKVFSKNSKYVKMELKGPLRYRRFAFFDYSTTLMELLNQIEAVKDNESISGIVINTSAMRINREMIWEIRKKLSEFKSKGKNVVVYIDRADINVYHLASVADKIVLDPAGSLYLTGFILGRQYYKGTLEKIGIGYRALKYFKYKTASETFSDDKLSDADREQYSELIDDIYKLARADITQSRRFSNSEYDDLIDKGFLFLPDEALKAGLVDTIARWNDMKDIIKSFEGEKKRFVRPGSLREFKLPGDNYWSKKSEIAVIYAIGVCAMDMGINARTLVKYVRDAVDDNNVKAIVLRVDSPGGDGLASDLIASTLNEGKGKKPIIVSQGFVAASGGYWLSMYADTIIAAPTTITGSIGVTGSYFFNKNLKEEFGVSTDFVKMGKHADLGFGLRLPLLGISIPDRDLNSDEVIKVENSIQSLYHKFVTKVSESRGLSYENIESLAQGRVWSGFDAKQNGLIDMIGGLSTAVKVAEERAGLKEEEYDLVEYPDRGWFNFGSFIPGLLGIEREVEIEKDPIIEDLKFRLKYNGHPMPIMPLSDVELLKE